MAIPKDNLIFLKMWCIKDTNYYKPRTSANFKFQKKIKSEEVKILYFKRYLNTVQNKKQTDKAVCFLKRLPRKVSESFVGFGHFVYVFFFLYGFSFSCCCKKKFICKEEFHIFSFFRSCSVDNPSHSKS